MGKQNRMKRRKENQRKEGGRKGREEERVEKGRRFEGKRERGGQEEGGKTEKTGSLGTSPTVHCIDRGYTKKKGTHFNYDGFSASSNTVLWSLITCFRFQTTWNINKHQGKIG